MALHPSGDSSARSGIPHFLSRVRRRWLWLGFCVAIVFLLSLPAWWIYQNWQQQQAIANVSKLGGYFGESEPSYPDWANRLRGVVGEQMLAAFRKPSHYKRVDLWLKPAVDADLERLATITDLTQLNLCGTKITDRGIAFLSGLTKLECLELAYTRVTDAGLVHLRGMTQLESLRLEQCEITDTAIPLLQAIGNPDLYVHLQESKVTSVKPEEFRVEPVGGGSVLRVGQILLIRGKYTVADPGYSPGEIDVKIIGHQDGSDEAAYFGAGTCQPTRRPGTNSGFDFQIELPAPKCPGEFKVDAMTSTKLHGFNGFYTTGVTEIRVLPALAEATNKDPKE